MPPISDTIKPERHAVCRTALLGLLAAVLLLWGAVPPSWAQNDLFRSTAGDRALGETLEARTRRFKVVTVDFGLLVSGIDFSQRKMGGEPLRLEMFDGLSYTARSDLIRDTADRVTVWEGRLEGIPHSEVILAYKDQVLSGNISVPGARYRIRSLGKGLHAVMEVNPNAYPPEKDPRPADPAAPLGGPAIQRDARALSAGPSVAAGPGFLYLPLVAKPPILDVLVVYTGAARLAAGGSPAMDTLIHLAVTETNAGYVNSGVRQIANLVHAEEVVYSEVGFDWDLTLDRLTGMTDGFMDNVHALRNTYRADAVILLVDNGFFCGQSWLMTVPSPAFAASAFGLVNWDCATGNYSFAHELGHLMGSHHDWNTTAEIGCFPYSKGYQAPDRSFRTIMAYDCLGGCPRINHWSNPGIFYNGQPTGVSEGNFHPADNSRSINNTTPTVINWR